MLTIFKQIFLFFFFFFFSLSLVSQIQSNLSRAMNVVLNGHVGRLASGARVLFAPPRVHWLRCAQVIERVAPGGYRAQFVPAFRTHASERAIFVPSSAIVAVLPPKVPLERLDAFERAATAAWRFVAPRALHRLLLSEPFFDIELMIHRVSCDASFRLQTSAPDELRLGALLLLNANSYLFRALDEGYYSCRPESLVSPLIDATVMLSNAARRADVLARFADRRVRTRSLAAADSATAAPDAAAPQTSDGATAPTDEAPPFPLVSQRPPTVVGGIDASAPFLWSDLADHPDTELSLHVLRHIALLRNRERLPSGLVFDFATQAVAARAAPLVTDAFLRRNGVWSEVHNPNLVDALLHNDVSMPAAPRHYTTRDALPDDVDAKLRTDFGTTRAYAIDDASTVDVDDAVSVERVAGGQVWVHVHVADVTSISPLQYGTDFEREAARRGVSVYFPERVYPMLPDDIVRECGLDTKQRRRAGAAALTFSMRLQNESGALLEWSVRPTTLATVQRITYEAVDDVLANVATQHTEGLTARCAEDLRLLNEIAQRRASFRRHKLGALMIHFPRPEVKVDDNFEIRIKSKRRRSPAASLVEELMVLAGEAAARAVTAHGVAAPFRQQQRPDGFDALRAMVNDASERGDMPALFASLQVPERATTLCVAGAHAGVGLPAYCRATSPLRRYNDTLLHHQLKRILYGREPLSADEMQPLVTHADVRARQARLLERRSQSYWVGVHMARTSQRSDSSTRPTYWRRMPCEVLEVREPVLGQSDDLSVLPKQKSGVCVLMHDDTCATMSATFSDMTLTPGMRVMAELVDVGVRGMHAKVLSVLSSSRAATAAAEPQQVKE
jgi:hypothetical protein